MGLASLSGLGAQTHFVPTDDKTEVGHSEGPPASSNTLLRGQGSPEEEQVLGDNRAPQAAARPPHDTYSGKRPPPLGPISSARGSCRGPELCLSLDRSFGRTAQSSSRDTGGQMLQNQR